MRPFRIVVAAGVFAAAPTLAQAQWYAGADAGITHAPDADVSGGSQSYGTDYEWGWGLLGQAGYAFGPLKVEGELGWRQNDVDSVGGQSGGGEVTSLSLMGNVLYEFMPDSSWRPFVGAGLGYARLDSDGVTRNGAAAYSGDDWQFAYQGFAGVAFDVARDLALKAQYRYFQTLDYDVASASGQTVSAEYGNHALLVGVTYRFSPPPPAPAPMAAAEPAPAPQPKPAPAPAPKAAPAPVPKNYMVFFDSDRADITPEAAAVIREAAQAVRDGQAARVQVVGHTDRSGADSYNARLAARRAEAVKAAMVKEGIAADRVGVSARGESEPLVKTPDGMREPQNRRVEIVLP